MIEVLENIVAGLFFLAICIAFFIGIISVIHDKPKFYGTIEECEASLPRDQYCVLVAVVAIDKKGNQ